jgi:prepilin-type N-terminal cleavage/methylation domain-containing protein
VKPNAQHGFTLLELMIALAIIGSMLAIAVGGLRVALATSAQGEDRAEAHQHLRSITLGLARTVGAAYPYSAAPGEAPEIVVLFRGTTERLELVTRTPLMPTPIPVAFTALVIALNRDGDPALEVRQRILPNRDPFSEAALVLHDPTVHRLDLAYLDATGTWRESWDGEAENALPRAVRIAVSIWRTGWSPDILSLTVPLRTVMP